MNATIFGQGCIFMLAASTLAAADATGVTTKEVMESVITPATNTLWGAEDSQTDEEWKVLEDPAIATITAGNFVAHGGDDLRLVPSLNSEDIWADAVAQLAQETSPIRL